MAKDVVTNPGGGGGAAGARVGSDVHQTSGGGGGASFGSSSSDVTNGISSLAPAFSSIITTIFVEGDLDDVLDTQFDLTKKYYAQSERDYQFWESNYAPQIKAIVEEYFGVDGAPGAGEQKYRVNYDNRRGPSSMKARRQADEAWLQRYNNTAPRAVGKMRWDAADAAELAFLGSVGLDDFAIRFELAYRDSIDNRRWNHRVSLVNVGIEAGNNAAQGMSSAVAELGAATQGIVGSKIAMGAGVIRAASAFGEMSKRREQNEDM